MSFKPLIAFVFISLMDTTNSTPKLCSKKTTPLKSFTTVTQLVNDSYLITANDRRFSLFESTEFVNFTESYSNIVTDDNSKFGENEFWFDIIFVIDINGFCINVEEKLFVIDLIEEQQSKTAVAHKYAYYTNQVWTRVNYMDYQNTGLDVLNKINEKKSIFKSKFKLVLYFQSFGLLVVNGVNESTLAYCTADGWKVSERALKSEIDFHKIDAGFVDNDEKVVYLFETDSISDDSKHNRKHYYNCSYTLRTSEVSLKCEKKSMSDLCLSEEPNNVNKQSLSMSLIALIVLVVIIVIIFQAIVCLLCCPAKKKDELSETHKTLVAGKESHAISSPEESVDSKKDQVKLIT